MFLIHTYYKNGVKDSIARLYTNGVLTQWLNFESDKLDGECFFYTNEGAIEYYDFYRMDSLVYGARYFNDSVIGQRGAAFILYDSTKVNFHVGDTFEFKFTLMNPPFLKKFAVIEFQNNENKTTYDTLFGPHRKIYMRNLQKAGKYRFKMQIFWGSDKAASAMHTVIDESIIVE
jgi:hypothetical protein